MRTTSERKRFIVMLIWIRSAVFFVGMAISSVVFWPITMIAWPMKPILRSRIISGWAHFVVFWLRLCCGLTHRVEGLENIPDQPGVILCNHQSAWETIALQTIFPAQAWVLKKELLKIPFFGWGLAASQPISIDRSTRMKALDQLITQGIDRMQQGRWVVVFPEGTRMAPGETGKFNPGAAMLATKAAAMVLPVAHNAGLFWKRRGFLKYPGEIVVKIGQPIDTTGKKAREVNTLAREWVESVSQNFDQ